MSRENILLFYRYLETHPEVQQKALNLQKEYEKEEEVIDAFLALAGETGFPFSLDEFLHHLYGQAEETKQ